MDSPSPIKVLQSMRFCVTEKYDRSNTSPWCARAGRLGCIFNTGSTVPGRKRPRNMRSSRMAQGRNFIIPTRRHTSSRQTGRPREWKDRREPCRRLTGFVEKKHLQAVPTALKHSMLTGDVILRFCNLSDEETTVSVSQPEVYTYDLLEKDQLQKEEKEIVLGKHEIRTIGWRA